MKIQLHFVKPLSLLGCSMLLGGVAVAQRQPKAPDPVPRRPRVTNSAPAIMATPMERTIVIGATAGPGINLQLWNSLTPEEQKAVGQHGEKVFSHDEAARFGLLPPDEMQGNFLDKAGVTDKKIQAALVAFVNYEEKKYGALRELKGKLVALLRDSTKDGAQNDVALSKLMSGIKDETAAREKEYALDLEKLDAEIHYAENPRLEAVMDALGLLRKEPIFAAGLTVSELVYVDPLRKISGEDKDFMGGMSGFVGGDDLSAGMTNVE